MRATPRVLPTGSLLRPTLVLLALALSACGSRTQQQAATEPAGTAAQTGATEPASAAPAVPASPVTQASWAPDTLEKLVAPIALYPDQLVGQILAASVNSQEVLDAGNWLLQNENLKGDALDAAAQKAGFGPPTRALVQFPSVVDMMCQEMDWTRQLGAAFTSDQRGVLDAVQQLRAQAAQVGNLKSTPQQKVETKVENDKTIIEVQPANPQVVYVPQYNPQVVYTTPPPPAPASTAGTVSTGAAVAGGLVAFGVGMLIGSAIHSDDYCYPHWGAGAVYVGPRPFYPPAYVYRPVYGPAFRPATGYVTPAGYRYAYNNVNVNRNVNVNVNNNYFNQFNHNQNLRGATQSNLSRATENNLGGATRNPNWKGQSSYAGARATPAETARFNQATGRPVDAGLSGSSSTRGSAGTAGNNRVGGGAGGTRNPALASNRASSPVLGQSRAASAPGEGRVPAQDRGYGGSNRGTGESGVGAGRNPGGGAAVTANSGGGNFCRAGESAVGSSAPQRSGAFSGASQPGGGGFERAASARGHASTGGAGFAARGGGHARR